MAKRQGTGLQNLYPPVQIRVAPPNENTPHPRGIFVLSALTHRFEPFRQRRSSNLKAKLKRLSIVLATLFTAKQGAPEASVSSDTVRLCDRCGVAPPTKKVPFLFIHCESNGISSRISEYLINRRLYRFRNDDMLAKSEIARFYADDIQCSALMICRNKLRMISTALP